LKIVVKLDAAQGTVQTLRKPAHTPRPVSYDSVPKRHYLHADVAVMRHWYSVLPGPAKCVSFSKSFTYNAYPHAPRRSHLLAALPAADYEHLLPADSVMLSPLKHSVH